MPKQEPERTCIVTRQARPAAELMRFVLGPDGTVVPDLRHRLPGRGAWLTPTAAILRDAVKRRSFTRAFKEDTKPAADLADQVDALLVRDLLGSLGLANKAGAVVTGFFKVEAALAAGSAAALLHARDAAEDGRRKLAAALRKRQAVAIYVLPVLDDLTEDEMDMALGRDHVVHAALLAGPGSEGCLSRWRRLRVYRGLDELPAAVGGGDDRQTGDRDQGGRTKTV